MKPSSLLEYEAYPPLQYLNMGIATKIWYANKTASPKKEWHLQKKMLDLSSSIFSGLATS